MALNLGGLATISGGPDLVASIHMVVHNNYPGDWLTDSRHYGHQKLNWHTDLHGGKTNKKWNEIFLQEMSSKLSDFLHLRVPLPRLPQFVLCC